MRLLHLDLDSVRPDHLGCYGYGRDTSPNLDRLAAEGRRYEACHCSDGPCLPSRTAMYSGRFGVATGVVDHGGSRCVPYPDPARGFKPRSASLPGLLRAAGHRTATVSSFADRHAAWHWLDGFAELRDPGGRGHECADAVEPLAIDWLRAHATEDDWFLHVNLWDAHVPYRAPATFGEPFTDEAPVAWLADFDAAPERSRPGLRSAVDSFAERGGGGTRGPERIGDKADVVRLLNGYDTGIRYADACVGRLLDELAAQRVLDDTAVLVTADHGEAFGELGGWSAHSHAVPGVMRVPGILRLPAAITPGTVAAAPCYLLDLAAALLDLAGVTVPDAWHGRPDAARDHLVCSLLAQAMQRAVRFTAGDRTWWYLRTWHDGWHGVGAETLFDLDDDPRCTGDRAAELPDLLARGRRLHADFLAAHATEHGDPLAEVLAAGGSQAVRGRAEAYARHLRETGREMLPGERP